MQFKMKNVRITFPKLFEASQVQGQGKEKHSAGFIFPKDHPQIGELKTLINEVAVAKWSTKAGDILAQLKAADKLPVHDGDSKSELEGYAGNLFMNASNAIRPAVFDEQKQPVTAADGKIYSGCYGTVIVDIWAQDNQFGKRINASLQGFQFTADGERLSGGGVATADDFDALPKAEADKVAEGTGGASDLF